MSNRAYLDKTISGEATLGLIEQLCRSARELGFNGTAVIESLTIHSDNDNNETSLSILVDQA